MIGIEKFKVLKKLSVGRLEITPKRVKAVYTVEKIDGSTAFTEMIFTYDNPYFDKKNPENVNLASMMSVQVALNYGLFCEELEFDGLFDKADISFIKNMTENTSREIITNKLLIENEFLKPEFRGLQIGKQATYTQAKLTFVNTQFANLKLEKTIAETDKNQYAILSSGGKDSLLTYGLLKEIGEPHPIYVNESGRHWFTAVNSYRHFKAIEPNTTKPWTNCDRVFNWMIKQMPFIKENYANIRADIYPIRLWTVAVFLFGVLPIARKRGIGNIVIGDEYDTTVKGNTNGISHYNGLYDQSKYFDNALTRYYEQKGWSMYQFSMLRSLSELLIMKTLIKRYPDLQQHQVSCHAASEKEGRMKPCGKCEKCRRIIGMVKTLDENPENCGYTAEQIEFGLKALTEKKVKQIGSDAAQLYFMLLEKGLIERNDFTKKAAKQHAEILKLRFDEERSNLEDLPMYLRKPLFEILKQYADGAVVRKAKKWESVEVNEAFLMAKPYKFG